MSRESTELRQALARRGDRLHDVRDAAKSVANTLTEFLDQHGVKDLRWRDRLTRSVDLLDREEVKCRDEDKPRGG
jgi:hypothetical protein